MIKDSDKPRKENLKRKKFREKLGMRKVILDKVVRESLLEEMCYQNKTD